MTSDTRAGELARCTQWGFTPSSDLDVRVQIRLISNEPHEPIHLRMRFPLDAYPIPLVSDLDAAGWRPPSLGEVDMHPAADTQQPPLPWRTDVPYPTAEITFTWQIAPTTTWSAAERTKAVAAARGVLRRYGITRSPVVDETWHDLI